MRLPHALVSQPARVAVVVAVLKGSLEVLGRGDDGRVVQAGTLGSGEGQRVALPRRAVVEDDAWKESGWHGSHGVRSVRGVHWVREVHCVQKGCRAHGLRGLDGMHGF